MAVKLVLYKLNYEIDPSAYNKRLESLKEAIRSLTATFWDEATSAVLIQYSGTAKELGDYLVTNSKLHTDETDMLVVVDMDTRQYASIGVQDSKLHVLMSLAKAYGITPPSTGIGGSSVAAALAGAPRKQWGQ